MTTLSQKLLNIYNENDLISKTLDDIDFLSLCKAFLVDNIRNNTSKYFEPYEFEGFTNLNNQTAIEILLALSADNTLLEKYYVLNCDVCDTPIIEKEISEIFFCRNIECSNKIPQEGDPLYEFIKKNVYYKFAISDDSRHLILKEARKNFPPPSFHDKRLTKNEKTTIEEIFADDVEVGAATLSERKSIQEYCFNPQSGL